MVSKIAISGTADEREACWPGGSPAQQILPRLALLLQFRQRFLELLLSKGVKFQPLDNGQAAFAFVAAGIAEDQAGRNAVLTPRDGCRAQPVLRRSGVKQAF